MGSGYPKIFDPIAIERMRASFHEILDALEEQYERPVCTENLNPDIVVMKSAKD